MTEPTRTWESLDEFLLDAAGALFPHLDQPEITVFSQASDGCTPLHVAAVRGDVQAINMVAAAGAKIDAVGDMGGTPLCDAVRQGHVEAAKRLLALGACPDILDEFNKTPAEIARQSDDPLMRELFSRK